MELLIFLAIGALAGFLGSKLFSGASKGLLVNMIVGIIGGILGGWLFGLLGFESAGIIGQIVTATVGSILLLWIISKFK
jgi:Transglycosylase associated protein.